MVADVKRYVANRAPPEGYSLSTWQDRSVDVHDRMELLARNGLQGLVLVFLVLAVFLHLRLAFWVALGIPISVLGACAVLLGAGHTLNMLSMFAFLIALGIVIGENVYAHRHRGKGLIRAAVDGTYEVLPSVTASVATTIIAFMPMLFVSGVMGKFIAILPVAVIAMLLISLGESMFVLPCHLAPSRAREEEVALPEEGEGSRGSEDLPGHALSKPATRQADGKGGGAARATLDGPSADATWAGHHGVLTSGAVYLVGAFLHSFHRLGLVFRWLNRQSDRVLQGFVRRVYLPLLRGALRRPGIVSQRVGGDFDLLFQPGPLGANWVAELVRVQLTPKSGDIGYYGEEVMRLERGRHEVKLMVRYPREDRRSLAHARI